MKIHGLAILCWGVAFFMWKDYFTNPTRQVAIDNLAFITGKLTSAGNEMSMPSGAASGHYIIIEEANRTFIPFKINWQQFIAEVPKGAVIMMAYSREEDPMASKKGIPVFSLKYNHKEYISEAGDVSWYNNAIIHKRNVAIYVTLGGFVLFGIVWWIRKKFFK